MIVSVVTASTLERETISACFESVENQSGDFFLEHVVVTRKGFKNPPNESWPGGKRIYLSQNFKGIYDALNKGVISSTGKVLCFLGDDDFLLEESISSRLERLYQSQCSAVFSKCTGLNPKVNNQSILSNDSLRLNELLLGLPKSQHASFLFWKESFLQIGLFKVYYFPMRLKVCADYLWLLKALKKDYKFNFLEKETVHISGIGISAKLIRPQLEAFWISFQNTPIRLKFFVLKHWILEIFQRFRRKVLGNEFQ